MNWLVFCVFAFFVFRVEVVQSDDLCDAAIAANCAPFVKVDDAMDEPLVAAIAGLCSSTETMNQHLANIQCVKNYINNNQGEGEACAADENKAYTRSFLEETRIKLAFKYFCDNEALATNYARCVRETYKDDLARCTNINTQLTTAALVVSLTRQRYKSSEYWICEYVRGYYDCLEPDTVGSSCTDAEHDVYKQFMRDLWGGVCYAHLSPAAPVRLSWLVALVGLTASVLLSMEKVWQ